MLKKKVLLIDDEDDFGLLLKTYFSKRGYDVFLSQTLEDGLQQIERIKPDVLILDDNLPDGRGWGKAEDLMKKNIQLQLILISAYHHDHSFIQKFPEVQILEKPISLIELSKFL